MTKEGEFIWTDINALKSEKKSLLKRIAEIDNILNQEA